MKTPGTLMHNVKDAKWNGVGYFDLSFISQTADRG